MTIIRVDKVLLYPKDAVADQLLLGSGQLLAFDQAFSHKDKVLVFFDGGAELLNVRVECNNGSNDEKGYQEIEGIYLLAEGCCCDDYCSPSSEE